MSDPCGFKLYDGCDCQPGECRSATVPIIKVLTAHDQRVKRDQSLSTIATTSAWVAAIIGCSLIIGIGAVIGRANSAEAAKINQEQVAVWNR